MHAAMEDDCLGQWMVRQNDLYGVAHSLENFPKQRKAALPNA
jgi:hypothetical protein